MCGFLGAFNHYQRMWSQCTRILAHFSSKSGKKSFCFTLEMDLAFKCMKAHMAQDCLLAYSNYNKPFHICNDAVSYQKESYIVQDDKLISFWSHKFNDAQLQYTIGDKELLSIVMVLTEFHAIPLGALLHIHTNHLNITTNNVTPDKIIWWLIYIEQFNHQRVLILCKKSNVSFLSLFQSYMYFFD